jgi:histidyl-tRNA synthetase
VYDVLEGLNLFPENLSESIKILLASFDEPSFEYAFRCATALRQAGIAVEIYPEPGKLKKQFEYAAKRNVPFVAILGDAEVNNGTLTVKDQKTGEQWTVSLEEAISKLLS